MKNIMIKDIPEDERPRERLIKVGANNLSNEELLSIILKTGYKNYSVKEISNILLSNFNGINGLKNASIRNLTSIKGIGKVKAIELLASLELGKRVFLIDENLSIKLDRTDKIYNYFKNLFYNEKQENFYAIYLDNKLKLISYKLLFKGTINKTCIHPREIFKYALLDNASFIVVLHNHPSGDATPSEEDITTTNNLVSLGRLFNIQVVDHIIFGKDIFYSFYETIHKSN